MAVGGPRHRALLRVHRRRQRGMGRVGVALQSQGKHGGLEHGSSCVISCLVPAIVFCSSEYLKRRKIIQRQRTTKWLKQPVKCREAGPRRSRGTTRRIRGTHRNTEPVLDQGTSIHGSENLSVATPRRHRLLPKEEYFRSTTAFL